MTFQNGLEQDVFIFVLLLLTVKFTNRVFVNKKYPRGIPQTLACEDKITSAILIDLPSLVSQEIKWKNQQSFSPTVVTNVNKEASLKTVEKVTLHI